jgi:hypothetical protein
MIALGAFEMDTIDATTGQPPHRPAGPGRRSQGGVSHLIRSFQRAVARAVDTEAAQWLPRIRSYPI